MHAVFEEIWARSVIKIQTLVAFVKLAAEVVDLVHGLPAANDAAHWPDNPAVTAIIRKLVEKILNLHFKVVNAARHDATFIEKNSHRGKTTKGIFVAIIVATLLRSDEIIVEISAEITLDVIHANGFGGG